MYTIVSRDVLLIERDRNECHVYIMSSRIPAEISFPVSSRTVIVVHNNIQIEFTAYCRVQIFECLFVGRIRSFKSYIWAHDLTFHTHTHRYSATTVKILSRGLYTPYITVYNIPLGTRPYILYHTITNRERREHRNWLWAAAGGFLYRKPPENKINSSTSISTVVKIPSDNVRIRIEPSPNVCNTKFSV